MPSGGPGRGGGRKPAALEFETSKKAIAAIVEKFGTIEKGFVSLLESDEPILQRFVWEHAVGKPTDKVKLEGQTDNKLEVIVRYEDRNNNAS